MISGSLRRKGAQPKEDVIQPGLTPKILRKQKAMPNIRIERMTYAMQSLQCGALPTELVRHDCNNPKLTLTFKISIYPFGTGSNSHSLSEDETTLGCLRVVGT